MRNTWNQRDIEISERLSGEKFICRVFDLLSGRYERERERERERE